MNPNTNKPDITNAMDNTATRSERNTLRHNQIVQAAVTVLQEKGVSNTSMNDIIRASGLSKGGVYHHFESKEALLVGVLDFFFELYVSDLSIDELTDKSAYDTMRLLLTDRQETLQRIGELNTLMLDLLTHAIAVPAIKAQFQHQYVHFQQQLAQILQRGIEQGEFRNDVDPVAIASGLMAVFDGMCSALIVAPDDVNFPYFAVDSALAMLEGIKV